jgi:hypothetical protein
MWEAAIACYPNAASQLANRDIERMKQRMAACRQSARDAVKHPADGLGEIFTMDEFNQSIRQ